MDEVIRKYDGHMSWIYRTGPNMGGFGTRSLASMHAKRLATITPVCAGEDPRRVVRALKNMPVWVFHGAKDAVVPPQGLEEIVEASKANGEKIKFTLYPDAGRDS